MGLVGLGRGSGIRDQGGPPPPPGERSERSERSERVNPGRITDQGLGIKWPPPPPPGVRVVRWARPLGAMVPGPQEFEDSAFPDKFYTLDISSGDRWRVLRKNLSPIFTSGKLKAMVAPISGEIEKLIAFIDEKKKQLLSLIIR